jgi:hypothetical protein
MSQTPNTSAERADGTAERPGSAHRRPRRLDWADDSGMSTAEYAVGTVAACGFAAVLYKAVTSDTVGRLLRGVIEQALSVNCL